MSDFHKKRFEFMSDCDETRYNKEMIKYNDEEKKASKKRREKSCTRREKEREGRAEKVRKAK